MLVGCISIVIILILMAVVFIRAKKPSYTLICIALIALPFFHVLCQIFLPKYMAHHMYLLVLTVVDIFMFVISSLSIVIISKKAKQHKQSKLSIVVCILYSLILLATLLTNSVIMKL